MKSLQQSLSKPHKSPTGVMGCDSITGGGRK